MTKDKDNALIEAVAVAILETHFPKNGGSPALAPGNHTAMKYAKAALPIISAHYEKERAEDKARIAELEEALCEMIDYEQDAPPVILRRAKQALAGKRTNES